MVGALHVETKTRKKAINGDELPREKSRKNDEPFLGNTTNFGGKKRAREICSTKKKEGRRWGGEGLGGGNTRDTNNETNDQKRMGGKRFQK